MFKQQAIQKTLLRLTVGALIFHLQVSYDFIASCLNATCENFPGEVSWVQAHLIKFLRYYNVDLTSKCIRKDTKIQCHALIF